MAKLLPLGLLCWACFAADPFVQQKAGGNAAGGGPLSFNATATAGNSIVVFTIAAISDSPLTISLIPGGQSLTSAVRKAVAATPPIQIWYIHNIPSGVTGVEVDSLDIGVNAFWTQVEFKPLTNAAPEATNTNSALASSTVTTGSATPASATNLVVAMGGWTANNYSSGPTNSFTRLTPSGGSGTFEEAAYLSQSSATAQSTGWTLTAGINWAGAIAVFGMPASGPTNAQRSAGFFMGPP